MDARHPTDVVQGVALPEVFRQAQIADTSSPAPASLANQKSDFGLKRRTSCLQVLDGVPGHESPPIRKSSMPVLSSVSGSQRMCGSAPRYCSQRASR